MGLELLALPFMQRAAVTLIVASTTLSLLGVVILALNMAAIRFTLMHLGLLGAALGMVTGTDPLLAGMTMISGGALLFGPVSERLKLDVGQTGMLFMTGSLAATFLLLSKANVPAMEAFSVFTGSVLTLEARDMVIAGALSVVVVGALWLWYWEINLVLFDKELAAALGVRSRQVHYGLLALLGLAIGVSIKLVGALMVDAIVMLPAMAALPVARSLKHAFALTALAGFLSATSGILFSVYLDLPVSASVTASAVLVLLASQLIRFVRRGRIGGLSSHAAFISEGSKESEENCNVQTG